MRLYSTLSGLTGTILTGIALILLLFGTRQFGGLEPWELGVFDIMMQLRPSLPPDPRLLVVEVTGKDIQSLGQWPMTDALMHQLLSKLQQYQPTVVGLNMYRDIPIPPGNSQLTQLFKDSDNIIPICRLGNETRRGTPPPEGVSQDQVGFADLAIDEGGVVRRALLFHNADIPEGCTTRLSFNFQLARYYLEHKGIEPQTIQQDEQEYLKWGDIVFKPLSPTSGGYQQADAGGYQILLNYRTGQKLADSVTLTDVLEDRVDPSLVKDRIVLIGVSDPAENDLFFTPYSSQGEVLQRMLGVVVHGHIVSQLLSTVLDGRPLFWFWTEWEEILWILGWALVGGSLTWKIRHPLVLGLSTTGALIVVFSICFFIFTRYGWIPVVAPTFALMSIPVVSISLRLPEFIMVSRVADVLQRCQTPGDIAAIANQLSWIHSPPPRVFGFIVPQFLEISQSVQPVREATSSYRQYEFLGRSISRLHRLQESLAFNTYAPQAIRLEKIARRWLKILQTAQQTLAEQAKRSAEIPQVYIAGASLNPDDAKTRFKGRQDIFREIETLAFSAQPPILLLHGGRRTGKTSALKYLPQKVGSELIPLLIDLQGAATATTLNGLANYLAEEIVKAAKKSRNFDLPYPNPQKLSQEPFLTLQTWLEKLERIAPGKRFLLCLDEFERLSEVIATTNSRIPLNFFRHVLQHRRQWILLFSGSHTLDELEPYWSDYLINTRSLRVSYLQQPEAEELIVQPIADFPKIYESLTVSQIIQATRCQPYLVQLLCTVIVDYLNREKRRLATPDDVQTCIPIAIETGGMYFRELWTSLSDSEQDFLEQLITEETPYPPNKSTVRRLIRKEILEKTGDCYRFQVPLVERFITQVVTEG